MSTVSRYVQQRASALSHGITMIRQILAETPFPNGFTTKQLYEIAQKCPAPKGFEPYQPPMPYLPKGQTPVPKPEHPVRSINFLKRQILPALEGCKEVTLVTQEKSGLFPEPDLSNLRPVRREKRKASAREFVWKVLKPEDLQAKPASETMDKVVGREVGVGLDIEHLNKRRQNARVKKVTRAVLELKAQMRLPGPLVEVAKLAEERPKF